MEEVVRLIARFLKTELESAEIAWNGVVSAFSGSALIIVSALLVEPILSLTVWKKIAIWTLLALIAIAMCTKPKMGLVIAMVITSLRWLWAAAISRNAIALCVAVGLSALASLIVYLDPQGTGFYSRRKA